MSGMIHKLVGKKYILSSNELLVPGYVSQSTLIVEILVVECQGAFQRNTFPNHYHEWHILCILETVFFYFQTNRERKIDNKKFGRKKKVSSVFTLYVCLCICVYVCLCVCLSVRALQTSSFNIGGWNFDIDTYMWISQNGIFYFFKFLLIFGVIPLFSFFTIFFISKLLVNLSWRSIHQIEAWNLWNILCIMILTLYSYDVTTWRHKFGKCR